MKSLAIVEDFEESIFKNYITATLQSLNVELKLVDVHNLDDSHVDYVVLNNSKSIENMEFMTDYCLINMDNGLNRNINIFGSIITYGFGNRNTVTISSLQYNNVSFVYCLQRYIKSDLDALIEPQEIPINADFISDNELYALMSAITIALIEGVSCKEIEKKLGRKLLIFK